MTIAGIRGSLLSHDALEAERFACLPADPAAHQAHRQFARHYEGIARDAGPAWPARLVYDRVAVPLCTLLGLEAVPQGADARSVRALLTRQGHPVAALLATPWGMSSSSAWSASVRLGIGSDVRWCCCFTGPALTIYDSRRTHSRRCVELSLADAAARHETFAVAWNLLAAPEPASALEAAVCLSERHRSRVRESLESGVHEALTHLTAAFTRAAGHRRRGDAASTLLDESLVVIYRVLFLLFAEARGLVPSWHPVFRDSYTVESLRERIETLPRPRGVWEALQAITRLAHRGCRAGSLRVPAFNGRLFSPRHAPLADTVPLDAAAVRSALLALTTRTTSRGRQRIAYGDLGVEHLGGVYERVLDFDFTCAPQGVPTLVATGRRKATGTFYTPRALTEYLVRRTLAPLVKDASPEQILALRILDPAMGSGAFLVAACRYLADAYEASLLREGSIGAGDLSDADRAGFRRIVAQRTLFGVDLNPMAVQLARLSLWLATLAQGRPLSFFDHHLRAGNSLVGARMRDVRGQASGRARARSGPLPLLEAAGLDGAMTEGVLAGLTLGTAAEETLEDVRAKEALFARLHAPGAPEVRDLPPPGQRCAGWFQPPDRRLGRAAFEALIDGALERPGGLTSGAVAPLLETVQRISSAERFFHWELEFPEVFYDGTGALLPDAGFDAIIGNPPWEMLRGDDDRAEVSRRGSHLTRFTRGSGLYRLQGAGHANLYQMFVERSLTLLRRGGRLGLVLPSGFASDHGSADLRRHLLEQTSIDSIVLAENRGGLFPIHRGLKFVLVTLTSGAERGTTLVPLRSGIRSPADFDRLPSVGEDPEAVGITRALVERLSGGQLAIPEIRSHRDATLVGRVVLHAPPAGSSEGWGLKFGRELNATDDKRHFTNGPGGLRIVEGKQVQPFSVDLAASRCFIDERVALRLLPSAPFARARVAYRDVASATNRLTLIAAVLPPHVVTTHTLFCLKTPLDEDAQHVIAGLMNSFVANYLVRLRVTTHVTVAIVERLPLPKPLRSSPEYRSLAALARRLSSAPGDVAAAAKLQAVGARLYGLRRDEFEHVLDTFPLVDGDLKRASLEEFTRTV